MLLNKYLRDPPPWLAPGEAKWMTDSVRRSPDLGYLEQFKFWLFFAPDNLKLGHSHHCLIEESVTLCTGYTRKNFNFWEQRVEISPGKVERIPIPLISSVDAKPMDFGTLEKFPQPRKIQGEVFAIKPHQFKELDDYKDNRVQFIRKRLDIVVPFRDVMDHNHEISGKALPRVLQGEKVTHSFERVHILRCWTYIANPAYWNPLLDGGFNGFRPVRSVQSGNPDRKNWLPSYYAYPKDKDRDL